MAGIKVQCPLTPTLFIVVFFHLAKLGQLGFLQIVWPGGAAVRWLQLSSILTHADLCLLHLKL